MGRVGGCSILNLYFLLADNLETVEISFLDDFLFRDIARLEKSCCTGDRTAGKISFDSNDAADQQFGARSRSQSQTVDRPYSRVLCEFSDCRWRAEGSRTLVN